MIQSVDRAVDIIIAVSDNKLQPISLGDIAEKTQLNKSTCAHIVQTLTERNFLTQVSKSKGYVLGPNAYYIVRHGNFKENLTNQCRPILQWLSKKVHHTALLAVIINDQKFVIAYSEDESEPLNERGSLFLGKIYDSATGRAILAAMDPVELQNLLKQIGRPEDGGWKGVKSTSQLQKEIERINESQVAYLEVQRDSTYNNSFGISLRAAKNAAIGVYVHTEYPLSRHEKDSIAKALLEAEAELFRRNSFEQLL